MAERYGDEIAYEPEPAQETPTQGRVSDRLDTQVQKAQEQLLTLRRQQEQIERQKRELEDLSRRQDELDQGRAEMIEKFTRALVVIDREGAEALKRVEQLRATNESFVSNLRALEEINPKSWASAEMQRELSRALSMVDHARTEYNQQRSRFAAEAPEGEVTAAEAFDAPLSERDKTFVYWLKAGTAFTLPLIVLGLIALCVWCAKAFSGL